MYEEEEGRFLSPTSTHGSFGFPEEDRLLRKDVVSLVSVSSSSSPTPHPLVHISRRYTRSVTRFVKEI